MNEARDFVSVSKRNACDISKKPCDSRKHHCWADFKKICLTATGPNSVETVKEKLINLKRSYDINSTMEGKKLHLIYGSEIVTLIEGSVNSISLDNNGRRQFNQSAR